MNCISLLDDSDDEIPLLPSGPSTSAGVPKANRSPALEKNCHLVEWKPQDVIDLLSSDDDMPILPTTKSHTSSNDSDETEVYSASDSELDACLKRVDAAPINKDDGNDPAAYHSDATEVYSVSEGSSGLPDLDDHELPGDNDPVLPVELPTGSTNKASAAMTIAAGTSSLAPTAAHNLRAMKRVSPTTTDEYTKIKNPRVSKMVEHEQKRLEKLKQQEVKRQAKERAALEKKRAAALKVAEREAKRAAQPGECHRHMLLEVDVNLENTNIGICLQAQCIASGVPIEYKSVPVSNSVIFKRKVTNTQNMEVSFIKEDHMAIILSMTDVVELIHQKHTTSLEDYLVSVIQTCQSKPTVVVIGCEKYFRAVKTRRNRCYKDDVLGTQNNSRKNESMAVISRLEYEEAVTALQMTINTVFINHEVEEDAAKTILQLNRSIAEAPVKRDRYRQQALSVKTTGLKFGQDGQGTRQIWQRMLQESRSLSADIAAAIVNAWPSPLLLYKEYQRCHNSAEAELLLQSLEVRRGGGVVQTRRRVGKEASRRVYELFTKSDPDYVIR